MTQARRWLVGPRRSSPTAGLHLIGRSISSARANIAAALLAGFLSAVAGCDDDPAANDDPGPTADVAGTIAQAKTGAGVPNLIVALVDEGAVRAVAATDEAGRFRFDDVPNGTYEAVITGLELSGLSLPHTALEPPVQGFTVTGEPVELVFATVGLIPPRVLGFVTCSGQPVRETPVRVLGGKDDVTALTNDQGKYAATDLDVGHHIVILAEPPCPGDTALRTVNLLPGQSVEVDFAR